jgi:hypothetical protein
MACAPPRRRAVKDRPAYPSEKKCSRRVSFPPAGRAALLAFAGVQVGLAQEQITTAVGLFGRNVALAAREATAFGDALIKYGVSLRNGDGQLRSSYEILLDFAVAVKGASSEQEKLALLQGAFGRSGRPMINLFEDGAEGIREFLTEAERVGAILAGTSSIAPTVQVTR